MNDPSIRLSEITAALRHIDTLDKVPGAKLGMPQHNVLWDAAAFLEAEFGSRPLESRRSLRQPYACGPVERY